MQEAQLQSLGQEDPLEKEMATHSSVLAWKIPWTKEPGGLQSMGLWRVRRGLVTEHTRQRSLEVLPCPGQLRPTEAHRTPNVSSAETCPRDLPRSAVRELAGLAPAGPSDEQWGGTQFPFPSGSCTLAEDKSQGDGRFRNDFSLLTLILHVPSRAFPLRNKTFIKAETFWTRAIVELRDDSLSS